jgi:CDP-glucose 4,6-dehydratase
MWDGQNSWITDRGSNAKEAHLLELDSSKARRELEWDDAMHFEKAIQMTVDFYKRALTGEQTIEIMKSQLNEFKRL